MLLHCTESISTLRWMWSNARRLVSIRHKIDGRSRNSDSIQWHAETLLQLLKSSNQSDTELRLKGRALRRAFHQAPAPASPTLSLSGKFPAVSRRHNWEARRSHLPVLNKPVRSSDPFQSPDQNTRSIS